MRGRGLGGGVARLDGGLELVGQRDDPAERVEAVLQVALGVGDAVVAVRDLRAVVGVDPVVPQQDELLVHGLLGRGHDAERGGEQVQPQARLVLLQADEARGARVQRGLRALAVGVERQAGLPAGDVGAPELLLARVLHHLGGVAGLLHRVGLRLVPDVGDHAGEQGQRQDHPERDGEACAHPDATQQEGHPCSSSSGRPRTRRTGQSSMTCSPGNRRWMSDRRIF